MALLTGCSAGGLTSIQRCYEFRALFSRISKVKYLVDAGLFLDAKELAMDVHFSYGCNFCTSTVSTEIDQNVVQNIQTPLLILNTTYDVWQEQFGTFGKKGVEEYSSMKR